MSKVYLDSRKYEELVNALDCVKYQTKFLASTFERDFFILDRNHYILMAVHDPSTETFASLITDAVCKNVRRSCKNAGE